jgi:hypothetical protein
MFAGYNVQGRTFRSTLEDLYLVKGIKSAKGLKQVARGIGDEKEPASRSYYNKEAITAYKQMIQAKHEEIIYHAYLRWTPESRQKSTEFKLHIRLHSQLDGAAPV